MPARGFGDLAPSRRRDRGTAHRPRNPWWWHRRSRRVRRTRSRVRLRDAGVADQHVSQTAVCDTQVKTPFGTRRRVSYPVSDSMSCIRRAHVPVPCAERARRSSRTDGLGDRFTVQPFTPTTTGHVLKYSRQYYIITIMYLLLFSVTSGPNCQLDRVDRLLTIQGAIYVAFKGCPTT